MKKMRSMSILLRGIVGVVMLGCANVLADTSSSTDTTTSWSSGDILNYLNAEQAMVGTSFDASYQRISNIFQQTGLSFLKTIDYQSLVCLGVMSGQSVLDQLQTDKMNFKISSANDFIALQNRLANIEERYQTQQQNNIGFVDTAAYQAAEQQIKADIDHIVNIQTGAIQNFEFGYKVKILKFVQDMGQYIVQNKDLLQTINEKLIKINYLMNASAQLDSGINQVYANLGIADVVSRIPTLQTATQSILLDTISPFIDIQIKKYKALTGLSGALSDLKTKTLQQYAQDGQSFLANTLSPWFNYAKYQDIQQRLLLLKNTYYPKGMLQCSQILISNPTQDALQNGLFGDISSLLSAVNSGVVASKNAGNSVKTQVMSGIQLLWGTGTAQKIVSFQTAVAGLITSLTQQATHTTSTTPPPVATNTGTVKSGANFPLPKGFTFTKLFTLNQHTANIGILQQFLTNRGYYTGAINSTYTQATKDAVYAFQRANKLIKPSDSKTLRGYFGPATRAKVNSLLK